MAGRFEDDSGVLRQSRFSSDSAPDGQSSLLDTIIPVGKTMLNATYGQIPAFAKGVVNGASFGMIGNQTPSEIAQEHSDAQSQPMPTGFLDTLGSQLPTPRKLGQVGGGIMAMIASEGMAGLPAEALVAKYGMGPVMEAATKGILTGAAYEGMKGAMQGKSPLETTGNMVKSGAEMGAFGGVGGALVEGARNLSRGLEGTSGLVHKTPGVLEETFNDPSLKFAPGIEDARQIYQNAKAGAGNVVPELSGGMEFVKSTLQKVNAGIANPVDALEARKVLTHSKEYIPYKQDYINQLDDVAKQLFTEADLSYSRGVKADAMRNMWALNKNGSPSVFRAAVALKEPWSIPLISPTIQGYGAAGLGLLNKAVPGEVKRAVVRRGLLSSGD